MVKLYNSACKHFVLPLADIFTRRTIYKKYKFLKEAQYWSAEKIREYQNKKMREVVRFAYNNIPYYRKMLDNIKLKPEDIKTTDDLVKLPILNKSIIRKEGIDNFIYGKKENLIKEVTSGSSGEQGTVYLSKEAQSLTYAAELLFFEWAGFSLGEKHLQTGVTERRSFEKKVKDLLFGCYYIGVSQLVTEADFEKALNLLRKAKILIGYASSLYGLAEYAKSRNKRVVLNSVINIGEALNGNYKQVIESAFGCKVKDIYGCAEGFQIAGQCEHQNYHICMPLNFVEIVDSKGNRVRDGTAGRVIVSRLDLNPMPLVRYDLGDLAVFSDESKCKCGRGLRMLKSILGRNSDFVITSKGHKMNLFHFIEVLEHEQLIKLWQVVQKKKGEILINLVVDKNFNELNKIKDKLLKMCGNSLKIQFRFVEDISLSKSGKRRFVVSSIKK